MIKSKIEKSPNNFIVITIMVLLFITTLLCFTLFLYKIFATKNWVGATFDYSDPCHA